MTADSHPESSRVTCTCSAVDVWHHVTCALIVDEIERTQRRRSSSDGA